jgi:hypothetical protein
MDKTANTAHRIECRNNNADIKVFFIWSTSSGKEIARTVSHCRMAATVRKSVPRFYGLALISLTFL